MPTQAEKERRIKASKKRLDEAQDKKHKFSLKVSEANADIEKEEQMLQWLEGMPVDDDSSEGIVWEDSADEDVPDVTVADE